MIVARKGRFILQGSLGEEGNSSRCSPVVAKIFRELAGSAGSPRGNISLHGCVECISTDDMVDMGRRVGPRLDHRVKSLNRERRALETKTSLDRHDEGEGSRSNPLHLDGRLDLDSIGSR